MNSVVVQNTQKHSNALVNGPVMCCTSHEVYIWTSGYKHDETTVINFENNRCDEWKNCFGPYDFCGFSINQ